MKIIPQPCLMSPPVIFHLARIIISIHHPRLSSYPIKVAFCNSPQKFWETTERTNLITDVCNPSFI